MRTTLLAKAILLASAFFVLAPAQAQHRCDDVYRSSLSACRGDHAARCDQARHDARRTCRHVGGHRCGEAQRYANDVCSTYSGCRSRAEHDYRNCRRSQRHYYR